MILPKAKFYETLQSHVVTESALHQKKKAELSVAFPFFATSFFLKLSSAAFPFCKITESQIREGRESRGMAFCREKQLYKKH